MLWEHPKWAYVTPYEKDNFIKQPSDVMLTSQ